MKVFHSFIGAALKIHSQRNRTLLDAALIASAAFLSLSASAYLALKPRDASGGVAVIFAPWSSAETTFLKAAEAGGRFVRFGGFPFIAVVVPEAADYSARMRAAGAWLVADPKALAACLQAAGRDSQ